jgi:hypothetical protein
MDTNHICCWKYQPVILNSQGSVSIIDDSFDTSMCAQ